jgi:phospholipase A1
MRPTRPRPSRLARSLALLPLLGLGLGAGAAAAQESEAPAPATPAACAGITSDAARLACYDAAVGRNLPTVAPPAAARALPSPDASAPERLEERLTRRPLRNQAEERAEAAARPAQALSPLDRRWELSDDAKLGTFNLRAHRPVYLLPGFWSSRPNQQPTSPNPDNRVGAPQDLQPIEAKFQLSLKTKVAQGVLFGEGDLWFGYTQSSRWQVYNGELSRPFRETVYEPEAMLVFGTDTRVLGWDMRLLGLGVNHQSNGRSLPLSRSWNRVMAQAAFEREDWMLVLRPWWRVSEDAADDDNADIEDYMGRGDLQLVHRRGEQEFALMLRHTLRGGEASRGAVQFDWSFPISRALRGHVQLFDGYGESMIDYNHRATYVGIGVSLFEWQ